MKLKWIIILLFLFCASNVAFGYSEKKPSMSKAEGYAKVKMFNEAINELRQIIDENPTYANAHLLLGDCFLATNQPSAAGASYERYLILKPSYGREIAPKLVRIGDALLASNQLSEANKNYSQAVNYYPSLKTQIAENIFQIARNNLYQRNYDLAENLFNMAVSYNSSIATKVGPAKSEYAMRLLTEAKTKPKNEREWYINTAKRYTSNSVIEKYFPPPKPVTVFKKEYTGRGMGLEEKNIIPDMPVFGKDIFVGYKVIVVGSVSKRLFNGWHEYPDGAESVCTTAPEGDTLGVRVPEGQKFEIVVQKLVE